MHVTDLEEIKNLVARAKELKTRKLQQALVADTDELSNNLLLLAESLAMVECYAQCALVRSLRVDKELQK